MKRIVYTSPFVPAELVAAHGLAPSRITLAGAAERSRHGTMGRCPFAESFIETVEQLDDASAAIVDTTCDQMRRGGELLARSFDRPVFVMNVPATWQTVAAETLYRQELDRLGRFLQRLGGTPPTHDRLVDTVVDYDDRRRRLRDLEGLVSPRRFAEALAEFAHSGKVDSTLPEDRYEATGHTPVALIGGPLRQEEFRLFDKVQRLGATVALDGTETGLRCLAGPVDLRAVRDDPMGQLVQAYFNGIADPYQRPNSRFFRWLGEAMAARQVRGLIVFRYVWCDRWAAEVRRLRDWCGLPVLELDQDDRGESAGRDNRLEAFIELLGHAT